MPKARRSDRWRLAPLFVVLAVIALSACSQQVAGPSTELEVRTGDAVRVASFDFAESELLGELFARSLEAEGLAVERFLALGSRELVEPALQQGMVDVVPEYLAAALDFEELAAAEIPGSAEAASQRLAEVLADDGITVLPHATAIDRDAVAMDEERAEELGIRTILDLARHADSLDFVGPPECPERSTCLPRLRSHYGIEFNSFTPLPAGLPIALALSAGEADVGLMFSSDPLVGDHGLVLLTDDRGFGRPENVVPLVRDEVLGRHGEAVERALGRITDALTTSELVRMNRRVARGESAVEVAESWLAKLP